MTENLREFWLALIGRRVQFWRLGPHDGNKYLSRKDRYLGFQTDWYDGPCGYSFGFWWFEAYWVDSWILREANR